jgi:hypothetical protein
LKGLCLCGAAQGCLYGGSSEEGPRADAWLFDAQALAWQQTATSDFGGFPGAAKAWQAAALLEGHDVRWRPLSLHACMRALLLLAERNLSEPNPREKGSGCVADEQHNLMLAVTREGLSDAVFAGLQGRRLMAYGGERSRSAAGEGEGGAAAVEGEAEDEADCEPIADVCSLEQHEGQHFWVALSINGAGRACPLGIIMHSICWLGSEASMGGDRIRTVGETGRRRENVNDGVVQQYGLQCQHLLNTLLQPCWGLMDHNVGRCM